eukprot:1257577-Rhodomonas_salina.2
MAVPGGARPPEGFVRHAGARAYLATPLLRTAISVCLHTQISYGIEKKGKWGLTLRDALPQEEWMEAKRGKIQRKPGTVRDLPTLYPVLTLRI